MGRRWWLGSNEAKIRIINEAETASHSKIPRRNSSSSESDERRSITLLMLLLLSLGAALFAELTSTVVEAADALRG